MNECCLRFAAVEKVYDRRFALRNISFELKVGETKRLLGANGAGKSTLLQVASGLMLPSSGKVELFGVSTRQRGNHLRRRLGVVMTYSFAISGFTVRENLSFYARLRGQAVNQELMQQLQLDTLPEQPIQQLSTGYRRRLDLAIGLSHPADLLILDEPFLGLDDISQQTLTSILKQRKAAGASLLMVAHGWHDTQTLIDGDLRLQNGLLTA